MSANLPFGVADVSLPARFELKGELGRGGMAVVLHAYDRVGEREVALKFLPSTGDEELRKRFHREAVDLANVYHKNVVDFYSLGESGGLDFIEMEYVNGGTLSEFIRNCDSLREELEVFAQIADGLAHIHQAGLVHRDMKPANVLMSKDGTPKISDLGLARHQEGQTQLTQEGSVMGTAAYLAPEQLRSHIVDHRADLYAYGVCLFEAVTSTRPFQANNPLALMRAHFEEQPPTPSDLVPGLPAELDNLILQLMEKRPEKRPQQAGEVADQLREIAATLTPMQDKLVTSSPQVLLARARYFIRCGDLHGANRILSELDPGGDQRLALQIDIEKARASVLGTPSGALEQAQKVVQDCRDADDLKLLGSALVVMGQAALKQGDWGIAKEALQEAQELVPSNNQALQLDLLNSLADLHEQGSSAGHQGLDTARATQYRKIADGIARRQDSKSTSAAPEQPKAIAGGATPNKSQTTISTAGLKSQMGRRMLLAALVVVLLIAAGGYFLTTRPARVEIVSDPPEATILVDDQRYVSPFKGQLEPGPHKLKVFLQGHFPQEEQLELKAGQLFTMTATLKPSSGNLNLISKPKGAKVFVNGQPKGETPLKLSGLPLKTFRVKFSKEGYKELEKEVEVMGGKTRNLEFALTQIPPPPVYRPSYSGGSYSNGSYSSGGSSSGSRSSGGYQNSGSGSSHRSTSPPPRSRGPSIRVSGGKVRVKVPKPKFRF